MKSCDQYFIILTDIAGKISLSKDTVQSIVRFAEKDRVFITTERMNTAGKWSIIDQHLTQEFLFARELRTEAKGESIFRVVDHFYKQKAIPLKKITAVATDGAPSIGGCYRGCVSYLKRVVPEVMTEHCVIHRQHFAAKHLSPRLNESVQHIITALCDEKDEEYNRLLLHTEVRWLPRGACLTRFYELFESVLLFFADEDVALRDILELRQADIAYLADLCEKFNAMNIQLQVGNLNLMKTKSVISSFVYKLALYERNVSRGEMFQFLNLAELKRCPDPSDQDIEVYWEYLEMLHEDLKRRFHDVLSMVVPNCHEDAELHLQKELVDLQPNDELKLRLRVLTDLLTRKRSRLQVVNQGDLRLRMKGVKPDIEKLARLHGRHDFSLPCVSVT
ncbi:hypothetical protein M514_02831 [Trichuris suis]|uniref:DUF4371 domain-containing protein n=1 Tax=Trichuris suis TaxID=68888 RepID=A0A085NEP6_9BILA|nr:hypothetical protein M514_02831 [Trichuris suis]